MPFFVLAALLLGFTALSRTRRARRGSVVRRADVRAALFVAGLAAMPVAFFLFAGRHDSIAWGAVEAVAFLALVVAIPILGVAQLVAFADTLEAAYWQRRQGSEFVTSLDYGVGEDWIEGRTATTPYREVAVDHFASSGSPAVAVRAILEDLVLMAIATTVVLGACSFFPGRYFTGNVRRDSPWRTTKLSLTQYRQSELTYRQLHPDDCAEPLDLKRRGEIDPITSLNDTWGHPITVSCLGDEIVVSSAGPDGRMGTADDLTVPPRDAD